MVPDHRQSANQKHDKRIGTLLVLDQKTLYDAKSKFAIFIEPSTLRQSANQNHDKRQYHEPTLN